MGLREWVFGKLVAKKAKEAAMGKLGGPFKTVWQFLDGWKSWIVAVVAVAKLAFPNTAATGYVDAVLSALGWDSVTGAFDPKEAMMAVGVIVALGHRLLKAIQQAKAEVPVTELLSEKKPA